MRGLFFLAWRHAAYYRWRTGLLILSISLAVAIPLAVRWAAEDLQQALLARSETVPFMVGGLGSATDLVIAGLYFHSQSLPMLKSADWNETEANELVQAIPLILGQTARSQPIVGTTLNYFRKNQITVAEGTLPVRLGDCVLGAELARTLNLTTGETLLTDAESFLNPAGQLPLKMRVTGVLEKTGGRDDQVVFVDLKTSWLIAGIGHGHESAEKLHEDQILSQNSGSVVTGANVQQFLEVTEENLDSFHFHGEMETFPLSLLLVYPVDEKSAIVWEGRQQSVETRQTVRPAEVVGELIALLVNLQRVVDVVALLVGMACLLLLVLIVAMSVQLREREMETFQAMGAGRRICARLIGLDLLLLGLWAIPVVVLATFLLQAVSQPLLMNMIL